MLNAARTSKDAVTMELRISCNGFFVRLRICVRKCLEADRCSRVSYLVLHEGCWDVLLVKANFDPAWSDLCKEVMDCISEIVATASTIQAGEMVSQDLRAWVRLTYLATKMQAEGWKSA